jgi:hypothetical protein
VQIVRHSTQVLLTLYAALNYNPEENTRVHNYHLLRGHRQQHNFDFEKRNQQNYQYLPSLFLDQRNHYNNLTLLHFDTEDLILIFQVVVLDW